jgi:hypothetical protein
LASENHGTFIRNIAEVPRREFPIISAARCRSRWSLPGVEHAISNSGLVDLVFLVITSPVTDDEKPV